jgi:hypothetical protein
VQHGHLAAEVVRVLQCSRYALAVSAARIMKGTWVVPGSLHLCLGVRRCVRSPAVRIGEQLEWWCGSAGPLGDAAVPRELLAELLVEDHQVSRGLPRATGGAGGRSLPPGRGARVPVCGLPTPCALPSIAARRPQANSELPAVPKERLRVMAQARAAGWPSHDTAAACLRGARLAALPLPPTPAQAAERGDGGGRGGVTAIFSATGPIGTARGAAARGALACPAGEGSRPCASRTCTYPCVDGWVAWVRRRCAQPDAAAAAPGC